ncbi:hypothetical protein EWB00_001170 [Schistosoma japonicum]|uniref:SJCHGC05495 protein n=1 Tax=Schistosoma japonicum TaxID=6182 RepID=Q5DAM9_SCHJA|nr:SJCHGC05495 protein [Schistosoma japonicum]TNN15573.1 hypothetical protein EWB00_001170 [Schistosoma japonicum]
MSFFGQSSYSSSSEDEGFWPPPGRRKRHPAGDRQPDESRSTSSDDCVSNILTRSSAVSIAQSSFQPHRFQFNQSPNSSSGVFSQPANYSYQSSEINFPSLFSGSFDNVQNCHENLNVNLCSRFNVCHIDDQPPSKDQFNSSTPPMLRRFLENQNDSRTECSQSLPPVRFQTWMTGSSLS